MIGTYLNEIRSLIINHFNNDNTVPDISDADFVLKNISSWEAGSTGNFDNKTVMSLVKIEEERAFRYQELQTVRGNDLITHNPTVFLNFYVIFAVTKPTDMTSALNTITDIIAFFQGQNVFEPTANRPDKLVFELCSLTFEQMNHLWGILGGKYMPSALYKVRIMPVKRLPDNGTTRIANLNVNETAL